MGIIELILILFCWTVFVLLMRHVGIRAGHWLEHFTEMRKLRKWMKEWRNGPDDKKGRV